jgi:hypothetical protein
MCFKDKIWRIYSKSGKQTVEKVYLFPIFSKKRRLSYKNILQFAVLYTYYGKNLENSAVKYPLF